MYLKKEFFHLYIFFCLPLTKEEKNNAFKRETNESRCKNKWTNDRNYLVDTARNIEIGKNLHKIVFIVSLDAFVLKNGLTNNESVLMLK